MERHQVALYVAALALGRSYRFTARSVAQLGLATRMTQTVPQCNSLR